jgi:hypothetical protein
VRSLPLPVPSLSISKTTWWLITSTGHLAAPGRTCWNLGAEAHRMDTPWHSNPQLSNPIPNYGSNSKNGGLQPCGVQPAGTRTTYTTHGKTQPSRNLSNNDRTFACFFNRTCTTCFSCFLSVSATNCLASSPIVSHLLKSE